MGAVSGKSGPDAKPLKDRILASIEIDDNECWIWQKFIRPNGYGEIGAGKGRSNYAHRVAYEEWVGPIPEGLQIDHLCRVRSCCNPEHLEPVTGKVNVLRSESFAAIYAKATHCTQGHEFTPENTYIRPGRGGRDCRECRREAIRKGHKARAKMQVGVAVADRVVVGEVTKTHCANGHEYTKENIYVDPRGNRQCRECRRDAVRRSQAKKAAAKTTESA